MRNAFYCDETIHIFRIILGNYYKLPTIVNQDHPLLLHATSEDDPDRRVQFCERFIPKYEEDNTFSYKILWADEAIFKHRHNSVYGHILILIRLLR